MPDKPVHVELSPKMVSGAVTSDEVLRSWEAIKAQENRAP